MNDSISDAAGAGSDLKKARRSRAAQPADAIKLDRLPPHDIPNEQGVLGCVLLAPRECLTEVANKFKGQKEAFYDLRHQMIFDALLEMQNAGVAIDVITLQEHLKKTGRLEQVGGIPYLSQLQDTVPSAANLEYYLNIVFEKWILRRMVRTCTDAVGRIYDYTGEVTALVAEVQNDILNLPSPTAAGPKHVGAYAASLKARVDNYARGVGMITGLPTGYRYWDKVFGGMHKTEVIILGGDPGSGKTSLAMNVVERVAVDGGNPVGVMSLEMSAEDLILRLACSKTRVNFHKLRTGCATKEELELIRDAMPHIMDEGETPIYMDDSGGLTMFEVRSRLRAMKHRHGIRLAVVDYLQLVALTREQMFLGMAAGYADVARGIQQAAKELEIPIIVLSQLSNEGRKRGKNERPKLTDFRETGAIGDVANFAGILWRPPLKEEEDEKLRAAIAADPMGEHMLAVRMEVLKNKNGPSGTGIEFNFLRWCMRFEDLQYESKGPENPD